MKTTRTIRTARTPRTTREIYSDLNQPIRSKNRAPLAPTPPAYTPRPRVHTQRQYTDTTAFRSIDDKTQTVEYVINSGRKTKAAQVQNWIDEFQPSPIEILRKIAEVSQPHQKLLTLICNELEKFPPDKLKDPISELNNDAFDEIAGIKIRSHDLEGEIENLKYEEDDLKRQLKEAEDDLQKTKEEYERYKRLVDMSTFNHFDNEQETKKRNDQVQMLTTKLRNDDESVQYNALWGENKHLSDETKKLESKIEQQRKLHEEFIHKRALKIAEKRTKPAIEQAEDDEYFAKSQPKQT